MAKTGFFLSFEGGEGSGKSTQAKRLADLLTEQGQKVLWTREPGGTPAGKKIRQILLENQDPPLSTSAELLLYMADRALHVEQVIRPALNQKKIIICDRYHDSTRAYQGDGRGFSKTHLETLEQLATKSLRPDLTILLDLPVELGLKRSKARLSEEKSLEDRFEQESLAFHQKVREGFLKMSKKENERFVVLDATQGPEILHQQIIKIFQERYA